MTTQGAATFITGKVIEELKYSEDDIVESMPWKAHHDSISCVTYISELNLLASSSYDQHVFIWDVQGDKMEQVGSLLLGKKPIPQGMDKS